MKNHRTHFRLSCFWLFVRLLIAGFLGPGLTRADSIGAATWRAALQQITGPLPPLSRRGPLHLQLGEAVNCDGYVRQRISYESDPGARVPAFLLIPNPALTNNRRSFPAVLALHQTHPAGNKVVVGLGQSPDDEYGVELVRRGYVVLAPPYPHLADYTPDLSPFQSGTLKAIWDNSRGLDLLTALPYVATNRGFAAIGHSLGGHNALFTAALDPRISIVATSCGFDSFQDYMDGQEAVWQAGRGWCQDRYMPRLAAYRGRLAQLPFDFPEILAAIAPRPIFVNAPLGDSNFRWRSVDRVVTAARQLSKQAGFPSQITVEHPDSSHRFPSDLREKAYQMFDTTLRR